MRPLAISPNSKCLRMGPSISRLHACIVWVWRNDSINAINCILLYSFDCNCNVKTLRIDPLIYLYENYIIYEISNEFKFSGYNLLVALSAHSKSAFVLVGSWPKPLSERIEFQPLAAQDIGPMATAVPRACACCIENFGLRKVQCGLGPVVRECVRTVRRVL